VQPLLLLLVVVQEERGKHGCQKDQGCIIPPQTLLAYSPCLAWTPAGPHTAGGTCSSTGGMGAEIIQLSVTITPW
jgi:hypothetical protein